jgi:FkbM family methyltransferase
MSSNLIYRLNQKWKYHTARTSFEKKVAEINRNHPLIFLLATTFTIKGSELVFDREHHAFIADRFQLFRELMEGNGTFRIQGNDLLYVIGDIKMKVTTSEEIFIIHEIFIQCCYSIAAPWTFNVFDIGMNVGYASLFFAGSQRVNKVYGFEPFPPTFEDARTNFNLNPALSGKLVLHNFGLGARSEKRNLVYSRDFKGKNSTSEGGMEGSQEVEIRNALQVFGEIIDRSPQEQYFVKMDCEGAEFEIIESLKGGIPQQIFGFIIEWHYHNPKPIVNALVAQGYKVQQRGTTDIGLITAFR